MTLVISLVGQPFVATASDRLVTLANPTTGNYVGRHDPQANKLVVAVLIDALICIGYTGNAYIGDRPTDEWIVQTIAPNSGIFEREAVGIFGFRRPSRLRLHQVCNRIRLGLAASTGGGGVLVQICGWRQRRNVMYRFSVRLQAEENLKKSIDLILRPSFPLDPLLIHVGASVIKNDIDQASINSNFNPCLVTPEVARDFLTAIVRKVSTRNRAVGSDVMSVILMHPSERKIRCCFDASRIYYGSMHNDRQMYKLPITYNPWVLTPNGFVAPRETTSAGEGAEIFEFDDWTIEIESHGGGPVVPSHFHWDRPQQRAKPPGTKRT